MSKNKKYFLTYGTKDFTIQKKHICHLAKRTNFFDDYISLSPTDLSIDFQNKFSDVLSKSVGAGYFLWKYKIIQETLSQTNENDVVFYIDAGSTINYNSSKKLDEYYEKLLSGNQSHLAFRMKHITEKFYTTKELFDYFNLTTKSKEANEGQFMATVLMFKNCKESFGLLDEFEKVVLTDPKLITDYYSRHSQIKGFQEHRHDQSIFSLLSKIYGCEEIEDETYFKDKPHLQYEYPVLTVRKRKYKFHRKIIFYLFYPYMINKPLFFKEKPSIIEKIIFKISKKLHSLIY